VTLGAEGVEARIEQVEPLGAETVVLLQLPGGARLHALMPGLARVEPGASTRVAVQPRAMLFFAADGRRLAA
jgi:TOBE domain